MISAKQVWYRAAKSGLRRPLNWLRHWGLGPNDAFIASYPRSGNTWLRFVLYEVLVAGQTADFDEVNHIVAEVGLHGPAIPLLPGGGRLIKTHEPYQKQYKKAIYLVRDARDVVLSEYAFQRGLGWFHGDLDEFVQHFVRGEVNPFTPWQKHIPGFLDSPLGNDMLLIKFEEMKRNTETVVSSVLDFLGVQVEAGAVRSAIANNTAQRMHEKEQHSPQMSDKAPKPSGPDESKFIRGGKVGGWRSRLSERQIELIEEHCGDVLQRMGYPTGRQVEAVSDSPLVVASA